MHLPMDFLEELQQVLGDDSRSYLRSFSDPPFRGISLNRLKTTPEHLLPLLDFMTRPSPFYQDGYYIPPDVQKIGSSPLHHAGAFYVQEPSASSAVQLLQIDNGDFVLDLCAAPGGKSAQIASLLGGSGLIWSNEVVRNRASVLLSNFERMGIPNGIVSSCYPDVLCPALMQCFDKVLVDAPCSGEGMFRKNPDAVTEWSREHVLSCASRQLSILQSAVHALRPGGIMVYSTCTFSPEENEFTVRKLLSLCPELEPFPIEEHFGRRTQLDNAVRISPLEGGEGHFAARFRKSGSAARRPLPSSKLPPQLTEMHRAAEAFLDDIFIHRPDLDIRIIGEHLYLMPKGIASLQGLGIIRAGVLAGTFVKNRIEPAHALFSASKPSDLRRVLPLSLADPRTHDFLCGMEINCSTPKGYTAVTIEGMPVGFGKCSSSTLKNKYPKSLRLS